MSAVLGEHASSAFRGSLVPPVPAPQKQGAADKTVMAVGPRPAPEEYVSQTGSGPQPGISLDAGTEKKLSRIQEVQVAFRAALTLADSIDDQYLLEPIL